MVEGIPLGRLRKSLDNMGDKVPSLYGVSSEHIVVGGVNVFHFFPKKSFLPEKLIIYLLF